MNLRKTFLYAFTLTLGMCTGFVAVAWSGPSGTAPNNNIAAPINVGSTGQSKVGGLELNTGGATNGLIVHGKVGVDTTSPSYNLHIAEPTWPNIGITKNGIGTWILGASDSSNSFGITLNATQLFTISTNGYAGIGTVNPSAKLTVADAGAPHITLYMLNATPGGLGRINFNHIRNSDSTEELMSYIQGVAENNQSNGGMRFVARNGSDVEAMRILSSGEVSIGNTNPYPYTKFALDNGTSNTWSEMINFFNGSPQGAYGLYTSGTTYALIANGPVQVYGTVTASAFYYSSDARLKKNIQPIASSTALQKVLALNPVTFNWIDPKSATTTQLGFIAQEVEKVVPELVTTDASTTMKAVDYARVTPLLVGAVQAQQAQIEAQDAKINAQQAEIDELKAEVELLKARQ